MKHLLHLHITGLSNGKVGIDNGSDVFSKTNFSWMKHKPYPIIYNRKIELETLSQIPLHITRALDRPDIGDSVEDSINQKQRRNDDTNTIDMYYNDRDTADSRNPEDKESLSL